jgi:biotin transport system ATP-binding protein
MALISLRGVRHVVGEAGTRRVVLSGLDLELREHRIGVIGANGSGKSTFARLLNGLALPTEGVVTVDGLDTRRDGAAVRRKVGFCFSDPDAQIVMPTVREDVALGLRRSGLRRAEVGELVLAALAAVGLAEHADHPAHLLSSGQKQLLALTSVLVTEPDVLVLDEPTTLLDLRNSREIGRRLAALPQQIVLATHDLTAVEAFDRVLTIENGRVVRDGDPAGAIAAYREAML